MKKTISMILALIIATSCIYVHAGIQTITKEYVYILGCMLHSGFDPCINIWLLHADGETEDVITDSKLFFNGESISAHDALEILHHTPSRFASISRNADGKLVSINISDAEPTVYTDITYGCFSGVTAAPGIQVMVYRPHKDRRPFKPHLAESFLYDIEVYRYGILVTNITDVSSNPIISLDVVAENNFGENSINVYADFTSPPEGDITYTLSDETGVIDAIITADTEVDFTNLPNADKTYLITASAPNSSTVGAYVKTQAVTAEYAYVAGSLSYSGFEANIEMLALYPDGSTQTFLFSNFVTIADEGSTRSMRGYDFSDEYSPGGPSALRRTFIRFAYTAEGKISAIALSGASPEKHYGVTLDEIQEAVPAVNILPVYSEIYSDRNYQEYIPPFPLSAGYLYDITVYDFAIVVNEVSHPDFGAIITGVMPYSYLFEEGGVIYRGIGAEEVEFSGDIEGDITFELYADPNGEPIETVIQPTPSVEFETALPNESATYYIKCRAENSDSRTVEITVEKAETQNAIFLGSMLYSGFSQAFEAWLFDKNDGKFTLLMQYRVKVNGTVIDYTNNWQISNELRNKPITYVVDEGVIKLIFFDESPAEPYDGITHAQLTALAGDLPIYFFPDIDEPGAYPIPLSPDALDDKCTYDVLADSRGVIITKLITNTAWSFFDSKIEDGVLTFTVNRSDTEAEESTLLIAVAYYDAYNQLIDMKYVQLQDGVTAEEYRCLIDNDATHSIKIIALDKASLSPVATKVDFN